MNTIKYSKLSELIENNFAKEYIHSKGFNLNSIFQWSCENGHWNTAKCLYDLSKENNYMKINICADYDYAFRYSCDNGHLDIAKWLYNLSKTDNNTKFNICADYDYRWSCRNGHSDTAKWMAKFIVCKV